MFKGHNILKLNEATVIAALQEYLNKRTVGDVLKVTSIRTETVNGSWWFSVSTEEGKPVK